MSSPRVPPANSLAAGVKTLEFTGEVLRLLDQTKLPVAEVYLDCRTSAEVALAITEMKVRGAPAIGVAAAYGLVLGGQAYLAMAGRDASCVGLLHHLEQVAASLLATRPTAVNLGWAVKRMLRTTRRLCTGDQTPADLLGALRSEAEAMQRDDVAMNKRLGDHGAALLHHGDTVLTHCNAGALATAGYGTALGVIRSAVAAGKQITVFVDETRPYLQGARLTAWELHKDHIPVTVIADNMAGYVMQQGRISAVIVGADRIAANGDVANKIGTYSLALLARAHGLPFYVAAPSSTVDLDTPNGEAIPIEERPPHELSHLAGQRLAPEGITIVNPAFDVTPAAYVTAIITEAGVLRPPYEEALRGLVAGAARRAG
ncbi:MAG: S-methyl-5-thioribose-1-phosphate isomerase [Candidatus Tectomicrobia bacterium]|nr:S-methyl-5-thioribose-1-phosphate isomerase [Candidatus Tectomicrobia bacterium]